MMKTKPQLDIRLLGGFSVTVDDRGIPSAEWRRKRAALLKLLALEPSHRLHREQAMERLWPAADPAAAALSLRVALHFIRDQLRQAGAPPHTFLVREGESLVLGPSALVQVDIDAF